MAESTRALGTKLLKGKTTPKTVGGLKSIGGLDLSAETIDTTTLDSPGGYRDFIAGFKDAGEVPFSGFFDPKDVGQADVYADFQAGNADDYVIEFPASLGAKWEFRAIVTKFSTGAELEDPLAFEGALKVKGEPTLTIA